LPVSASSAFMLAVSILVPLPAILAADPGASPDPPLEPQETREEKKGEPPDKAWWDEIPWEDEAEAEDGATTDKDGERRFLYKELVLSVLYSRKGVVGIPPNKTRTDHLLFSPRPPGNYVGLDYVQTFESSSGVNGFLPESFPLTAIDLHPRFVWDRLEESDDYDQVKFAPQDFWARFNPGGRDRVAVRVGQFVLPYGVNPIFAPRQRFILPVESTDLGLKWDWGVGLRAPAGEYDWELAATIGSGEALHSPHLLGDSKRKSYLFTGRFGTPTYWDLQYGASFLIGDLPVLRASKRLSPFSLSRWRLGLDGLYKYGTYLLGGAQVTYGQDGWTNDEEFVGVTGGKTADVLGYRAWVDWVVPQLLDLQLSAQYESVIRDLGEHRDDTAAVFELTYSLTTSISLMLDYRYELERAMGEENNAIFFTFVYYGL